MAGMNRDGLRAMLAEMDLAGRDAEVVARDRMIELLDSEPRCFRRDAFPGHFVGGALVLNADGSRALLHHHRKLDRWLQFGGHCDGEENVLEVARREAREECGIDGLVVASGKPFDLDVHPIPERPGEPWHEHYELRWVLIAPEGARPVCSDESHELRWFTPDEMAALPSDGGTDRMVEKWKALLARRGHRGSRAPGCA
ncbi:MAG: NUDIX hydrolase [Akkermansiaceae bacterium]|nr:NUDIX hydrolase [Akkermansiaceae bacterium]